jgi:hypothetical protein
MTYFWMETKDLKIQILPLLVCHWEEVSILEKENETNETDIPPVILAYSGKSVYPGPGFK